MLLKFCPIDNNIQGTKTKVKKNQVLVSKPSRYPQDYSQDKAKSLLSYANLPES